MKVGDTVILVNDNNFYNTNNHLYFRSLTVGKSYTIIGIDRLGSDFEELGLSFEVLLLINDKGELDNYLNVNFKTLKEYRKQKLLKIESL